MKRVRALLWFAVRFAPLALLVALVAMWIASLFYQFGYTHIVRGRHWIAGALAANVVVESLAGLPRPEGFFLREYHVGQKRPYFGRFGFHFGALPDSSRYDAIQIPVPWLVTLLLPAAIGPFLRYRYPLWTWFAWGAIVAGETAFYHPRF